nr:hypothetical protein [Tanacetum cinerariifolium]
NLRPKGFQISLLFLAGYPNLLMVHRLRNDHVASILGYGVLQWGNILIIKASRYAFWKISLGLDLTYDPSIITTQQPTKRELGLLFEAMYDDYIGGQPSAATRTALTAQAPQIIQTPTASTTTTDTAPTPKKSSSQATNIPNTSQDVDELETQQQHVQQQDKQALLKAKTIADNVPNAMLAGNSFVNPFATPSTSAVESSSS